MLKGCFGGGQRSSTFSADVNSVLCFELFFFYICALCLSRPYSTIGANSTETTQSNELPGYEPPFKERRLSRKLILRQETTPKQNSIWTPAFKKNVHEVYVNDDHDDQENTSPDQTNSMEKSRNETSQYPIFTETILENTQFQNVLVDNINRMLETSSERIDVSVESGTNDPMACNNSLQEQVKHAIDNIIMSTEQDPTFQQVLDDVVQHTANHEQSTRIMPTTIEISDNNESVEVSVPLKQRLRNRSLDKPRPNYNEIDQGTKKKRKGKVEVISNEIVSGEIRDLLHPSTATTTTTTTIRADSYVPLNQILYLNPDKNTPTYSGQDLVYVNVGSCVPSFSQFRIDADTPMYLQDISLANSGTTTSLTPGSIINLPTIEQQLQPIQSLMPNVIIKDIVEVTKTKQTERPIKTTPSAAKIVNLPKARNLTSPRRSHVRSLNFTNADDAITESDRLATVHKRNDSTKKMDTACTTKSEATRNAECDNSNQKSSLTKASLEEVEPQQDSSDAVDFSKEFDEATVISVELSPAETMPVGTKETPTVEPVNEKKKPQTRRQCQKDLEKWNKMRQMTKGEWDNYLRQTVASKTGKGSAHNKKKLKKRKLKNTSTIDDANVSAENGANTTTDIEARLLEEALQSAKKPEQPVTRNNTSTVEITKESTDAEPVKPNASSPVTQKTESANSAQKGDCPNLRSSPNKRCSSTRKLIQIKLPASAKKKLKTTTIKRRAKPTPKRPSTVPKQFHKPPVETSQIDPSQTIDIDLISPIEHPKELNIAVKSGVNLNSFLETPCKEASSFKYPITPGFAVSSLIKTPGVRNIKDYDSLIKFPEYPTPSFAITPGRTKTPMSQSSSQKDGSSYNRATDYSSGSSYYKPDESDDIDKNIENLIRETRIECSLGVDPPHHSGKHEALSEGELSDTSSSSSSSSQTSSTSSCSSSPTNTVSPNDNRNPVTTCKSQHDPRTQQQLRLEQVRLRTMATLKSDKKIERFRKPKTKMSSLQRHKVVVEAMKKPMQNLKMTGNSTPKGTPKILPKSVNKPNQKTMTTTPSKRKIATPRRVIYLDYKDTIKTSVRVHDRKQAEQLLSQSNVNTNVNARPSTSTNPERVTTPTSETIDAIENHIAKTSHNSFVESSATKLSNSSQVDTPHLLQQLQDKNDVTDSKTPEMGPPATKRATLVRELFGDATMSDSDFDTPIKSSKGIPIPRGDGETSADSIKSVTPKLVPKLLPSVDKQSVDGSLNVSANDTKSEQSKIDSDANAPSSHSKDVTDSMADDGKDSHDRDSMGSENTDAKTGEVLIANDSATSKCSEEGAVVDDSDNNESDDGDDYDECALISSLPMSNGSNRIYQTVTSDTNECAITLNTESLDLRPMSTFLDGKIISIKTCDEVVMFSFSPKTISPSTAPSGSKNAPKKRANVKSIDVRKVDDRPKKLQKFGPDGTDAVARFNIVAKQKGPIDVSSGQISSR